jgi:predicted transcriptional regulator
MTNRSWKEIKGKRLTPNARARVAARTKRLLDEIPLQELRRARELSQITLASAMGVAQSEVSKIEHRTDLYVSTLRNYIEAMGGSLEIVARFPDGEVKIQAFEEAMTASVIA